MTVMKGDRPRHPVMADVARLAGVSHMTVSRVLNDHPSVRPDTRARVERAIEQLRYRPNTAARALVTRETRTLGVISVDTSHYGPAHTLFGIQEAARSAGYFVTLVSLGEVDRTQMSEAIEHLMAAAVDGIIVIAPVVDVVESVQGQSPDVPLVVAEARPRNGITSVVVDQTAGARQATRHLLDLGHTAVLHVRGPDEWLEAEARVRGWEAELAASGIAATEPLVGDWTPDSGYDLGQQIARRTDVTAVFVANDQMALGVLLALHEAGRAVPGELSIVGFDDIPEAAFFLPPLTTVRQDFAEVGRACIATVLGLIAGTFNGKSLVVPPDLIVRRSTSAPGAKSGT